MFLLKHDHWIQTATYSECSGQKMFDEMLGNDFDTMADQLQFRVLQRRKRKILKQSTICSSSLGKQTNATKSNSSFRTARPPIISRSTTRRLPLVLLTTLTLLLIPTFTTSKGITLHDLISPKTYDPNDISTTCYAPLVASDTNGDGIVQTNEYVTFVASLSDGYYNVTTFDALPFVVKINFVYLSCLCNYNGGGDGCCAGENAGLFVSGAEAGDVPTEEEQVYLETVCGDTQGSIDYAIEQEAVAGPTSVPGGVPTVSPATSPTLSPVTSPTASPIESPTSSPVTSPTTSPIESPTTSPIESPTSSPVKSPTTSPMLSPTSSPIASPTATPAVTPTISPVVTSTPVGQPTASPVIIPSSSSVPTSVTTTKEPSALIVPEPTISPTKAPSKAETEPPVAVSPTTKQPTATTPIPAPTPQETTIAPTISLAPSNVPSINAVVTSPDESRGGDEETTSEGLSAGGIAGITLAAVFLAYAWLYGLATWKKHRWNPRPEDPSLEGIIDKDGDLEAGTANGTDKNGPSPSNEREETVAYEKNGAAPQSTSKAAALVSGGPYSPENLCDSPPPELDAASSSDDESSSAGASGWSTSDGLSSLNTAPSYDASEGVAPGTPGSMLAAIGVASAITTTAALAGKSNPAKRSVDYDETGSISSARAMASQAVGVHSSPSEPSQSKVTRSDLDAAIEAGDWAAVGATAALLAQSSDVTDTASEREDSTDSRASIGSSARITELDRLVEAGDWEGVVLAAAKYEGASDVESTPNQSALGDIDAEMRVSEIRAEVEALVRRVVPDEIDNVDEMMLQFEGREQELVETLRTMQERSVAQRARAAVHQSAKLQAMAQSPPQGYQASRQRSGSSSSDSDPSVYEECSSSLSDLGESEDMSSRNTAQSSLELAVERGDWRAVGEAAAMMGDGSSRIVVDSETSSTGSSYQSQSRHDRIMHLDALIEKGDWSGIVAAASKYHAMDELEGTGVSSSNPPTPGKLTEDERKALAEADMWKAIANQSKQGNENADKGASDAADWAISRSLEQLKNGHSATSTDETGLQQEGAVDDNSV